MDFTKAFSCRDIVESGVLFSVPIYQRLFVWGEEQIDKLLNDILCAKQSLKSAYYIGVITVKENAKGRWELVDGQQRNTFLSLFAAECCTVKNGVSREKWSLLLHGGPLHADRESLRVRYIGRDDDEIDLQRLMAGRACEMTNQNFKVFDRIFRKWCANMTEGEFKEVSDYVYCSVKYLFSVLPPQYNPTELNLFFERMNAAGQQLGVVDIVKGRYFPSESGLIDRILDFSKAYVESDIEGRQCGKAMRLLDILEDKETPPKEASEKCVPRVRSVLTSELIMLHALSATLDLPVEKLLCDPRSMVNEFGCHMNTVESKERFLRSLREYRRFLDDHVVYIDTESVGHTYCFRKEDGTPTNQDADRARTSALDSDLPVVNRLRQFESMLYVSQPESGRWVYSAFCRFKEVKSFTRRSLLEYLMSWDIRQDVLPQLGDMNYGQIERKWFWRLDYILWDILTNGRRGTDVDGIPASLYEAGRMQAIKSYVFRINRSIEHLHPQTATDQNRTEWDALFDKNNESFGSVENCFGNLAMISSSFNSVQSNEQIKTKCSRIDDQVRERRVESLKMMVMAAQVGNGSDADWTVDVAKRHGVAMYNLLSAVYGEYATKEVPINLEEGAEQCGTVVPSEKDPTLIIDSIEWSALPYGDGVSVAVSRRRDACLRGSWCGRYFNLKKDGELVLSDSWVGCRYGGEFYVAGRGWVSCRESPVFVVQVDKDNYRKVKDGKLVDGWYEGLGRDEVDPWESNWINYVIAVDGGCRGVEAEFVRVIRELID